MSDRFGKADLVPIFSFTIPRGKNSPASKARGKLKRKLFRQALLHRQHIIDREVGFHERAEETTRRIVEQRRQQAAKMNPEMNQPPPLEISGKEVNIPVPDRIEPQRIRLDNFRNPWSRDLTGKPSRLQRPERASQPDQRPRPAKDRPSRSRIPVVDKQPPSRSSRPAVVKPSDFIPPTGKDRFYHPYSPRPVRLRQRSITPPGYPESEEDEFIP
ncbi:hypothetical protein DAPPUDRAFT_246653 [Daphnia pulex]|uniref:Uncharacterized protein n=1 Tax=Daphnia pulex TaxID=6669 RepID=E9GR02_DAPPU|nr:hypothetical protein DAPPUDRAFT_246653 [Daphnia pulex]|eukprot:EFX78079.1 hypothetical protein DAPPUDRAFT_246653 [Daphnia pulex]